MLQRHRPLTRAARAAAVASALALLVSRNCAAAEPTVPECLAASDASLQSGNERKRLAERDQLLTCAQPSCPRIVREECERRLEEVNRRMATVVFDVRDAEDRPLNGVTILLDGRLLDARRKDEPVPVDPGEHRILFRVAGKPEVGRNITVREAEKDRPIFVRLGSAAQARATAESASPEERARVQRTFALASAGLAVAGIATGTAFGLVAWQQRNKARELCEDACANRAGVDAWQDARRSGHFATAGFIVGGVAAAGAAALWLTLKTSGSTRLGLGPGAALVTGEF